METQWIDQDKMDKPGWSAKRVVEASVVQMKREWWVFLNCFLKYLNWKRINNQINDFWLYQTSQIYNLWPLYVIDITL